MAPARIRYGFPYSIRLQLETIVEQCIAENGGRAVGNPSVVGGGKILEVDDHPWWSQHMAVAYKQLMAMAINQAGMDQASGNGTSQS